MPRVIGETWIWNQRAHVFSLLEKNMDSIQSFKCFSDVLFNQWYILKRTTTYKISKN